MRTPEEERREGEQLAPALYALGSVVPTTDGVEITGPPLRGRVHLMSCYTPAWWYAVCGVCHAIQGSSQDPDDPYLRRWAIQHRCGAEHVCEAIAAYGWSEGRGLS